MRLAISLQITLIAAALLAPLNVEGQSSINGPSLGFTPDSAGALISPIIGVPGAAMLTDQLELTTEIRGAVISPKQDYAVAVRVEDSRAVVIDLASGSQAVIDIAGIDAGADVIAVSPTGSMAAVYDDQSKTIQVIGHLPRSPEVLGRFDASGIPGLGAGLAISDDGTTALARFIENDSLSMWVLTDSGSTWRIASDYPAAAAFFPNRLDAVVTGDSTPAASLIVDTTHGGIQIPLISIVDGVDRFSNVSTSEDGRRVFLEDSVSGVIAIVEVRTGTWSLVSCQCRATNLSRLKGNSVFRLNDGSNEPMMVLDASAVEPRIVVIPAKAAEQ